MNLLVVTNLYPQELGGYGHQWPISYGACGNGATASRCLQRCTPSGCQRRLRPGGSGGSATAAQRQLSRWCNHLENPHQRQAIDEANATIIRSWVNSQNWDGVLLGNLDLLGPELLPPILEASCIVQHHVGFVHAPFPPSAWPCNDRYRLVTASKAVRSALVSAGLPTSTCRVIYPGVRSELFGIDRVRMPPPLAPDGSRQRPLKVCFAGLLMGSKGAHTLIEALIQLQQQGLSVQASLADSFQSGYREQLEGWLTEHSLDGAVRFVGQLDRQALAGFMPYIMLASFLPYIQRPSGLWPEK